jgi:hypothetical protein
MHTLGTLLIWSARAVGTLVGVNFALFMKRWLEEGQVWHVALLISLLHALLIIMLRALYAMGMRCRAIHYQATRGLTVEISNR